MESSSSFYLSDKVRINAPPSGLKTLNYDKLAKNPGTKFWKKVVSYKNSNFDFEKKNLGKNINLFWEIF